MEKVNLKAAFARIDSYWSPHLAGTVNDASVRLAKLKGPFVWHHHELEDELFLVVKGRLCMELRDREVWIDEGEFFIVPRGVEHRPVAPEEVHVLLFEPATTRNTGNVQNDLTRTELPSI